ncbi:MAG TPA: DNA topoisomerase VI, partial [Planctomycetota bacterium]|nr:DNA topoisomerase VI [Planctomycetota bacterium]
MAKASVEERLIGLADVVIESAKKKKDPEFQIPVRALSNVEFNEKKRLIMMKEATTGRSFFNLGMARKFMQTMLVADALAELQR